MNKLQKAIGKTFEILTGRKLKTAEASYDTLDEPGYRRITERDIKGLDVITRDRQLKIVFNLYMVNPFAKTIIDTINDFVFGDGFSFDIEIDDGIPKYKKDDAFKLLNSFWIRNKFDETFEKKGLDLSLNGMLVLPVFVNDKNGDVRLGFVDPTNIESVNVNPLNVEDIQTITLKPISAQGRKEMKVVKVNETDTMSEQFGLLDGEVLFFSINNVSNQPEGISDLLVSADMMDMLQQLLYSILKNAELSYQYFEDVKISGASQEEIDQWKARNPIDTQGARRVHNENVEHKHETADIKSQNSAEIVRLFKNIVLLSKRMPEHWFADGGNSNLATAVEQGTAVFRMLKKRQQYVASILETIFKFVMHQAVLHKKEGFRVTREDLIENKVRVKINVPKFEIKDFDKVSKSVNEISDFLNKGVSGGFITQETAGKIYRSMTTMFGYAVDEEAESEKLELIEKEKEPAPASPEPPNPDNQTV